MNMKRILRKISSAIIVVEKILFSSSSFSESNEEKKCDNDFIFWLMMRQIKTTERKSLFFVEWITTWRWTWLKEITDNTVRRINDLLLKQNQFQHQSVHANNNKQLSSSSIKDNDRNKKQRINNKAI